MSKKSLSTDKIERELLNEYYANSESEEEDDYVDQVIDDFEPSSPDYNESSCAANPAAVYNVFYSPRHDNEDFNTHSHFTNQLLQNVDIDQALENFDQDFEDFISQNDVLKNNQPTTSESILELTSPALRKIQNAKLRTPSQNINLKWSKKVKSFHPILHEFDPSHSGIQCEECGLCSGPQAYNDLWMMLLGLLK